METTRLKSRPATAEKRVSVVELTTMPQQMEVRGPEDDWTGVTSAAERRKLQNRLNQRLYRRRRGAKPKWQTPTPVHPAAINLEPTAAQKELLRKFRGLIQAVATPEADTNDSSSPSSHDSQQPSPGKPDVTRTARPCLASQVTPTELRQMTEKYEALARRDFLLGSPRVDQLLTLIQFNVFRALINNTVTMGWDFAWLECEEPISPWNRADAPQLALCPASLRPTPVQQAIVHHPWIDLWPIPQMRDNLLLAGETYDEDRLCNDLVEFCEIPNEQTGLIVWGEPWDPAGWEVSENFVRNWGWVVKGCVELLRSTNYWRKRRGESPLIFEVQDIGAGGGIES
ncbi:hypothetical protein BP5796_07544 [Coleophoma crateriformis]|uniref:BZIP domain-containing protein n=1 Tax=Coleophoma crateriformis TaxID=565419 RepID=A0A3D8RJ80_9HELO|nr:hypothetical protein BP5796_07544 [Coleophoma crateriformis]